VHEIGCKQAVNRNANEFILNVFVVLPVMVINRLISRIHNRKRLINHVYSSLAISSLRGLGKLFFKKITRYTSLHVIRWKK